MPIILRENISFSLSERVEKIYDSLTCFSEIKAVEAVYCQQISEVSYSVYVFCKSNVLIIPSSEQTNEILKSHLNFFQFSYLQGVTEDMFEDDKETIVIFKRISK